MWSWLSRRPAWLAVLFTGVVVLLQASSLLSEVVAYHDNEELQNATIGLELANGHLTDVLLLQPRPYCGGCSVTSIAAASLFSLLPPTFFVFKLVPLLFYVAMLLAGFRVVRCYVGLEAAIVFALLWSLPPYAWLRIALVSYGNHYESVFYALLALNLALPAALAHRERRRVPAWRYLGLGAVLGFGVYTCFTATFAVPALLLLAALRMPRSIRFPVYTAAGFGLGASPWALYWKVTGTNPVTSPIYRDDDLTFGLEYIPHKVATLLSPRQLEAIAGYPTVPAGRLLAWGAVLAVVVVLGVAVRLAWRALFPPAPEASPPGDPIPQTVGLPDAAISLSGPGSDTAPLVALAGILLLGSWLGLYLSARYFNIEFPESGWPSPIGLRYLAPVYMSVPLLAATVWDSLRRGGPGRRRLSLALLCALLASGAFCRLAVFTQAPLSTAAWHKLGADYPFFRPQAAWQLSETQHATCSSQAPRSQAFHQWALGWRDGFRALNEPGGGEGARQEKSDEGSSIEARRSQAIQALAALRPPRPDQARAYYHGVAWALRDQIVRPDRPLLEVMLELADYTREMPEETWTIIAREVLRVPDWLEQVANRHPEQKHHAQLLDVIAPLEGATAPHDLVGPVVWGLGFVASSWSLPAAFDAPRSLTGMLELGAYRLAGRRWADWTGARSMGVVPPFPPPLQEIFVQGFGEGLGQRWGTRFDAPPRPEGIPEEAVDRYLEAWKRGQAEYFVE